MYQCGITWASHCSSMHPITTWPQDPFLPLLQYNSFRDLYLKAFSITFPWVWLCSGPSIWSPLKGFVAFWQTRVQLGAGNSFWTLTDWLLGITRPATIKGKERERLYGGLVAGTIIDRALSSMKLVVEPPTIWEGKEEADSQQIRRLKKTEDFNGLALWQRMCKGFNLNQGWVTATIFNARPQPWNML